MGGAICSRASDSGRVNSRGRLVILDVVPGTVVVELLITVDDRQRRTRHHADRRLVGPTRACDYAPMSRASLCVASCPRSVSACARPRPMHRQRPRSATTTPFDPGAPTDRNIYLSRAPSGTNASGGLFHFTGGSQFSRRFRTVFRRMLT